MRTHTPPTGYLMLYPNSQRNQAVCGGMVTEVYRYPYPSIKAMRVLANLAGYKTALVR